MHDEICNAIEGYEPDMGFDDENPIDMEYDSWGAFGNMDQGGQMKPTNVYQEYVIEDALGIDKTYKLVFRKKEHMVEYANRHNLKIDWTLTYCVVHSYEDVEEYAIVYKHMHVFLPDDVD